MSALAAISLVVFMEARGEPAETQQLIASFAIEAARERNISVEKSLRVKGLYSWNWDGKATPVDKTFVKDKIEPIVKKELSRKTRSLSGYKYFNKCSGRKFPGKMLRSNNVCFYRG